MQAELDIGPLTWVKGEIDLALARAGESLAGCGGTPARLQAARKHLHQAHGALSIVGLDGLTYFSDAVEQFLVAIEEGKCAWSEPVERAACQALAAIHLYLDDLVGGRPDQPLRLYPAYRDMALARGQSEPPAADLFFPDLTQRPPRREHEPAPLAPEALAARIKVARLGYERGLLKWLKNDPKGVTEMRNSVAVIEMTQATPAARAFWWAALAFLDAVAAQTLPPDAEIRRLGPRIDAQIKKLAEGSATVSERLMREVLYFVACAGPSGDHAECVRAAYRLADMIPDRQARPDIETQRPLLRAAREHLAVAMEEWNRFCGGAAAALPNFHERLGRCTEKLGQVGEADFDRLGAALLALLDQLRRNPLRQDETIAIEVATALLLLESAIENFGALDAEFTHQATVVAERLAALVRGEPLASRELPRLDEIARQAREKMLMSQVAKEILANLAFVEQTLDAFFRDPTRNATLAELAKPLRQIEGALAVLGQERAVAVLHETGEHIAVFAQPDYIALQADFEEVARKLSALGFFVEQLQSGHADIDALLEPAAARPAPLDAAAPSVEAELKAMKRMTQTLVDALRDAPEDIGLRSEVRLNLESLREDARLVADSELEQRADVAIAALEAAAPATDFADAVAALAPPAAMPAAPTPELVELAAAGEERIDAELLSIFLEEAHEVLATIGAACPQAHAAPGEHETLRVLRRAFHTLKGSGRMVGLLELGEAAWAVEQTMNLWLQQERDATPELLAMLDAAHLLFRDWVAQLEGGGSTHRDVGALAADCEALRSAPFEAPAPVAETAPPAKPLLQLVHSAPPAEPPICIGNVEMSPTLYRIYLDEARGHLATLQAELGRAGSPRQELVRAAHTLASISATGGIASVHGLAHALENALVRCAAANAAPDDDQRMLLARTVGALEGMVGAVAERRLPGREAELGAELDALVPPSADAAPPTAAEERRQARIGNEIDPQLLPLFLAEGDEQLPEIAAQLRAWREQPADTDMPDRLKRLLHTFKGNARMAGAMAIGELVHGMESRVVQAAAQGTPPEFFDGMENSLDRLVALVEGLQEPSATEETSVPATSLPEADAAPRALLRVRADLVDRLVNEAGEMAIARARIEGEMRNLKGSLLELTENAIRLRNQLREIEIQAESQMQSRQADTASHAREFDPLEFDRFTRFQELTRMMAESVNDVATVQHNLLRNVDHAQAALTAQARLNRELSQTLMNVRMVPFNTVAERLHRIVRQTAKETGKRANLDVRGGQTEIDRSVLERMTAPLEHLLRNAVAHGIEPPSERVASGKPDCGEIVLTLAQEGNEFLMTLADDGAGLDFARIRATAMARGLLAPDAAADEQQLAQLIFVSGFTTAEQLTEVAGRGVGMDVVRNETTGLGGRIEVAARAGGGTSFRIWLPLTLAVTQAVLVRAGNAVYALPSTMVEQASEMKPAAAEQARAEHGVEWQGQFYPLHYLPALLGDATARPQAARRYWILLLRSGARRIALEVDGMVGNQEIVVKHIGPQLARIAGIAGATVLGDGGIVLIVNPVALAGRPGVAAASAGTVPAVSANVAPTILVVDDSLTVRKITGRLLARAGYQVLTAKDGVDALEQMADLVPDVLLADIEMPRMDGFELARGVKADARLRGVPIIMITSRTADKHRDYARQIGVEHYLGKPYDENELLALIAGFVKPAGAG